MDDKTRNRVDAFERCDQWFTDHSAQVNSNTKLKNVVSDFSAKLADLHNAAAQEAGAADESKQNTNEKGGSREECIAIAMKVNHAAKAAEIEAPGIATRYPNPKSANDEDLVNLLRSYAIGGAADETIIEAYGAPHDWPALCTNAATAFEAAEMAQSAAKSDRVGSRALILSLADELLLLKRTAGLIIDNVFESDVAALASWRSAAHIELPPAKKKKPPTP